MLSWGTGLSLARVLLALVRSIALHCTLYQNICAVNLVTEFCLSLVPPRQLFPQAEAPKGPVAAKEAVLGPGALEGRGGGGGGQGVRVLQRVVVQQVSGVFPGLLGIASTPTRPHGSFVSSAAADTCHFD